MFRHRIHLVTFAAGKPCWSRAASRLVRQSAAFPEITSYTKFTPDTLHQVIPREAQSIHKMASRHHRGYGLWAWKIPLISASLRAMNSGETLIYLDAGSSLNSGTVSTNRLRQYVEMSANSGALFFQQKLTEKAWTKSSLRKTFPEDSHWESGQALGGIMVLNSSPVTLEFLDHISGLARHNNYEALLEPGVDEVQDDAFVAHRHDQSIISLAAKDTTFTMIPDETFFAPNWPQAGKDYPIWASRLCSGNDDLSGTIGNRVRREIERRLPF